MLNLQQHYRRRSARKFGNGKSMLQQQFERLVRKYHFKFKAKILSLKTQLKYFIRTS